MLTSDRRPCLLHLWALALSQQSVRLMGLDAAQDAQYLGNNHMTRRLIILHFPALLEQGHCRHSGRVTNKCD